MPYHLIIPTGFTMNTFIQSQKTLTNGHYIAEDLPLVPYGNNQFETAEPMSLDQLCLSMILLIEKRFQRHDGTLISPSNTHNYLVAKLARSEREIFSCIYLDNQHRVIGYEELFYGTIDGASVYPREIVKAALKHNAAAVIFAHNHPSGITTPSQADKDITGKLIAALKTVDIRVLDHIIVGGSQTLSFSEKGLI